MPYQPADRDVFFIPNWNEVHPDLHPRYLSTKAEKLRGHMMDWGSGGYVRYGDGKTSDELKEAVTKLGLNESYINTNLNQVMVGDLVLAYISRVEFDRRCKEKLHMVSEKEQAEIDGYLGSQTSKGVRPIVMDEESFKDRKRFQTRESNNRVGYSASRVA
jgi:hypothetical protein